MQASGDQRREIAKSYSAVIASEAKQSILSLCRDMDCFASLAMTWIDRRPYSAVPCPNAFRSIAFRSIA
jgi:hypothetical protein